MMFLGIATVQMMRFNISVAMAIMAGSGHLNITTSDLLPSQTPMNGSYLASSDNALMKMHDRNISKSSDSKDSDEKETEFNWSSHTQGLLLAAFFIGYTLGNIPAGWLADKLGGKWIIFGGACGSAIFNALGPLAARSSVALFFATRFLAGISEGFIFPAVNTMVNNWSPVNERTRMMTFIVAGMAFGPAIGQSLSGIICANLGWPASFYFFGGLTITWAFFWAVTTNEDPSRHPFITRKERVYIETTRSKRSGTKKVPIRSILLSLPCIAFCVVLFGIPGFVYFCLACSLPIYFKHVLGFEILSVGFLTSIPYVCQWIISLLASSIADALSGRNILSRTSVRKFTICSGALIMAACFLTISFVVQRNTSFIVILMSVMYGAMGLVFSAAFVNALDIAPSFSGTVTGIGNGIAVTSGFIAPLVTAVFTEDQADPEGWRTVFIITAAITLISALVFLVFGSGDVQPWAIPIDADVHRMDKNQPLSIKDPEENAAMMEKIIIKPRLICLTKLP
eukprot:XP_001198778.2 PREDICTED: sialin [Strongylocentrotus purpuratus]